MGESGIREFIKWDDPQIRKEGLVVDVRSNGGGNVSQMLILRLSRELLGTRFARTRMSLPPTRTVSMATWSACSARTRPRTATSSRTASARRVSARSSARLVAVVAGITNRGTLIDGGTVYVPEFGTKRRPRTAAGSSKATAWIRTSRWISMRPRGLPRGRDPQLERASKRCCAGWRRSRYSSRAGGSEDPEIQDLKNRTEKETT